MLDNWLRIALDWAFPWYCQLCGAATRDLALCPGCCAELPWNQTACRVCALPMTRPGLICGRCQSQPPAFDETFAALCYAPPVDHLVKRVKFGGELSLVPALGELMLRYLRTRLPPVPEALVPVPLHPARLRERGFNQARELARAVARGWDLPVAGGAVIRRRPTAPQSELPLSRRRHNPRGAFEVRSERIPTHVAIVDDVMTTGATATTLARALRRAGARRVDVWCLSRTPAVNR